MKKYTMVMRFGDAKAPTELMNYVLIGEDYSFMRASGEEIAKEIHANRIEVSNLGVLPGKGLIATNGAMDKYTLIDRSGAIVGVSRAVILNRIETPKGLTGYTVYTGVLQEMDVTTVVSMAKKGLIANGKIRHTQDGDIVSSINGNYPIRLIKIADATEGKIDVDIIFIGSALAGNKNIKYAGVIVNGGNAATITKLHSTLLKSNEKLIEQVKDATGVNEKDSLGVKITGSAGFYGVYNTDIVLKLIEKADNIVGIPMNSLTIACMDYDAESEAQITVDKKLNIVNHVDGSAKANESLKVYAKEMVNKLKGYEFKG